MQARAVTFGIAAASALAAPAMAHADFAHDLIQVTCAPSIKVFRVEQFSVEDRPVMEAEDTAKGRAELKAQHLVHPRKDGSVGSCTIEGRRIEFHVVHFMEASDRGACRGADAADFMVTVDGRKIGEGQLFGGCSSPTDHLFQAELNYDHLNPDLQGVLHCFTPAAGGDTRTCEFLRFH